MKLQYVFFLISAVFSSRVVTPVVCLALSLATLCVALILAIVEAIT